MPNPEFELFLERKDREAKAVAEVDWESLKTQWLDALGTLYRDVETWLGAYVRAGKIKIEKSTCDLFEEEFGHYTVESRIITIGQNRVILKPVGALLLGARGRVDLEGPRETAMLLLQREGEPIRISFSSGTPA